MSADDRRTHLIERAAARLRQSLPQPVVAGAPVGAAVATAELREISGIGTQDTASEKRKPEPAIDIFALRKGGLIDWDSSGGRIAEEFRIAQMNLLRQAHGGNGAVLAPPRNLVMVTSALNNEGKSFTSLNLAAGVAREGASGVLLIDADSRRRGLGDAFGLSAVPGLFDLCREQGPRINDVVVRTATASLDFIPAGKREGSETVSMARLASVIGDIGAHYSGRLVIIDTPACLLSSDAHNFAAAVGQIVLVVAAGSTQQGDVEAALGLLRACPVVSLLLNKLPSWNAHSFRAYAYPTAAP